MWGKYFCETVKGKPTKEYILERIIPRPRDIIYMCKASIDEAINSEHSIVEENDILKGEKKYSQYALDSLLVEKGIRAQKLETILYEFLGATEILHRNQVLLILKDAKIEEDEFENIINVLLDLTFLGLEISHNNFIFLYNENDKLKYNILARKYVKNSREKEYRYSINRVFHSYLEIKQNGIIY